MDKIKIDWPTVITDSYNLAYRINQYFRPEIIVFLGRGAMVPASIASHVLGVKNVYNLGMRSYSNKEKQNIVIIQELGNNFCKEAKNKNVLVLDELSDTGGTLYMAKNILDKCNLRNVYYATLYIKHKTSFVPDCFIKGFDKKIWLDFPWEYDIIY